MEGLSGSIDYTLRLHVSEYNISRVFCNGKDFTKQVLFRAVSIKVHFHKNVFFISLIFRTHFSNQFREALVSQHKAPYTAYQVDVPLGQLTDRLELKCRPAISAFALLTSQFREKQKSKIQLQLEADEKETVSCCDVILFEALRHRFWL